MKEINLEKRHLDTLRGLFRRHLEEAQVLAYGSRVTGKHHEGSDLDLAVRHALDPEKKVVGIDILRGAIEDSDIPILVDLQEWCRINETFRAEILRQGILLWPEEEAETP
jgi:predicted nucleotidyltransferase